MARHRAGSSGDTQDPIGLPGSASIAARRMQVEKQAGRVLIGPKKLGQGYARIVADKDGSGRIEIFDIVSKTWIPASHSITFSDVWSAPPAPMFSSAD